MQKRARLDIHSTLTGNEVHRRKNERFATSESDGQVSNVRVYEKQTKTRQRKGRSASRSASRERKSKNETRRSPRIDDSSLDDSSSSDEDTRTSTLTKPKHYLKPPKFDGLASFETFWAQFKNCAEHNKWERAQKLVYLRSLLDKEVVNVLWVYGKEVTESLSGLTNILKMRFGGISFADKHRIEIRNRRRTPNETLQSLHIDIRRLAALAFPTMEHRTHEVISCGYFLDALADPDFALKIRERHPEDLDSALRIALQLEVWTKDSVRLCEATTRERNKDVGTKDEAKGEPKKMREVTKPKSTSDNHNEELKKEVEEQKKKIAELENRLSKVPTQKTSPDVQYPYKPRPNTSSLTCYRCGGPGHMAKDCKTQTPRNPNGFGPWTT